MPECEAASKGKAVSYVLKHSWRYFIGNTGTGSVWANRHYFAKRFATPAEWRAWIVQNLNGFADQLDRLHIVHLVPKGTTKKARR